MESSKQIEERAAAWLAKRDSGEWSSGDDAQLAQWLDASTANYIAFIRLEAAWEQGLRLKALSTGPDAVPPPGQWQFSPFFNDAAPASETLRSSANTASSSGRIAPKFPAPMLRSLAIAAGIVLILGVGAFLANGVIRGDRYVTPVGGVASLPIADGSKITLNTDSEIRVALSRAERLIMLEQGEAFFEVAKDPSRPFVVSTGKQRVVAVGTKFSVRREGNQLRVLVTEGAVRLEEEGSVPKSAERATQLSVGNIARTTVDKVLVDSRPLQEVEEYLSWRTGYLVFHESSLADASAEFNRYHAQKIVIDDSAVAAIRFSGKFRSANLDAFVRILENGFSVRATVEDDRIVLSSR